MRRQGILVIVGKVVATGAASEVDSLVVVAVVFREKSLVVVTVVHY